MVYQYYQKCICCIYVYADTLVINRTGLPLRFDRTDISWQSDRDTRFQNNNGSTTTPDSNNVQPKNWLSDITNLTNGLQNEDLIVWFRVSAFPNFIKLYARVRVDGRDSLPAGDYSLNVNYNILNMHLSIHFIIVIWM